MSEFLYSLSAISTGLMIASPPNLAGRENRLRSRLDRIVCPVMLGMRKFLILSSMGCKFTAMSGVVLIRKDHLREEP